MFQRFRTPLWPISMLAAALLAACAAPGTPGTNTTPGKPAAPAVPTPLPTPARPSPEAQPPSVTIQGRAAAAVLDDIVRYRTGRGMTLKIRTGNRVEFTMPVQKTKVPTEARMRYLLTPVSGNLQLSARVFQVLNPGTGREQVNEITNEVASQLERELAGYAGNDRR
ncbi:hypothetical protein [Andreprevotia sp. IGB-42]|uniref:hypothetical protein n=1 Tax=Andreprevotia sp. IGB-42 TaxID=2497473 RepID=UPI001357EF39|nr:hypothetical protein [Andreprevotia sp. IGB-42]